MKTTLSTASVVLLLGTSAAFAQEACTSYQIQPGDSLSAIARTAYGSIDFQQIWNANRETIGGNPNSISVGMQLVLPCLDGTLPGATTASVSPAPAPAAITTSQERLNIRLVTGNDYQPFTDESMEGGGVITQILRNALATVEDRADTDISFVNDWGSHMDVLLPSGAFDGTFPWVVPNCEDPAITENMQARCDNYRFADPVYEIVTGMITRDGDALATTDAHADFVGKTVCVPDGYAKIVLSAGGVADEDLTYTSPAAPETCFEQLVAGSVDAVELELSQAADVISRQGIEDQVAVNDQISSVSVLTLYVHKDNPEGDAILEAVNTGLANIRESGMWFQTVQEGFRTYYSE